MSKRGIRFLAHGAIVAALYVVLTYLTNLLGLAFGPVQFRLSEALCVLPCVMPAAAPGVFVGCLVSNLLSPYGLLDLVVGSLATLFAALTTLRIRRRALVPLPTILFNAVMVGAMIAYYETAGGSGAFFAAFLYNAATVGLGEAVVTYALGLPLLKWLPKSLYE
ncbi:MAG: QueT transporter family protein [Oscillibacter sp.]|nr:QueT transporter family protein [Oscillibacter sp.]